MKTVAFFNNKGGVGKTSLVYHLAWMFAEHGVPVLTVDLDPQANLTAMFLEEYRLEELWPDTEDHPSTVYGAVQPILDGEGDITVPGAEVILPDLALLPGDLALSRFEDNLSDAWPRCMMSENRAPFRTMTAFHRIMEAMAETSRVEVVLIDVGPNLGAINRSALIAADMVCLPLAPDLFSLQGLRNLGPTLRRWRDEWRQMSAKAPTNLSLPAGTMAPIGYVLMQHGVFSKRPVKAYLKWMERIPRVYRENILHENASDRLPPVAEDPYCLAQLKHYRSLMPLAMEAHKPMFHLTPTDGAIGAHIGAVHDCYSDFLALAKRIGEAIGIQIPQRD